MSRLSIKDVAKQAGVCIGTVSRVINNADRVHPETRQKILKIIEETGYRPSSTGRALVSGRVHNILVVLHDTSDPYCAAISKIFSQHWHSLGYKMLLGDSNYDAEREREYLAYARDGSVDGLIVSPIPGQSNAATYRRLVKERFPFVVIDNRVEAVQTNCAKYDDQTAARIAIEHLAQNGHRHITFAHRRNEFQTVKDRLAGYLEALRRLKLPVNALFHEPLPHSLPDTSEAFRRLLLLKPRPTAILAENEITAIVCMNTLLKAGFRIPEDVAVVAIGDTLIDPFAPIPLTAVSLRQDLMCRQAVDILLALIDPPDSEKHSPVQAVIRPELIVRAST